MNFRPQRVGKLIQHELGLFLAKELEFPNALVTITDVEVEGKLDHAVVRLSVIPSSAAEESLRIAARSAGRLQHLLLKKINIKPMPRIRFEIDHGPENAAAVEKALLDA